MHARGYMVPFYAPRKIGGAIAGEDQKNFSRKAGPSKSFHHPKLVFMALAVGDAQKIRKWKAVGITLRTIRRVNPAAHVVDLFGRHSGPFHNLRACKFRDRKNAGSTTTSAFQDCCIIQPNGWAAILRTVNVTKIVNCEDERGGAEQGSVVTWGEEEVVLSQVAERTRKPPGVQGRGRVSP